MAKIKHAADKDPAKNVMCFACRGKIRKTCAWKFDTGRYDDHRLCQHCYDELMSHQLSREECIDQDCIEECVETYKKHWPNEHDNDEERKKDCENECWKPYTPGCEDDSNYTEPKYTNNFQAIPMTDEEESLYDEDHGEYIGRR